MEELIRVEDMEKYYGSKNNLIKAVDRISFTVSKGEFTGIMGASGSGKTTLLNLLATVDMVTSGHIYYGPEDITRLSEDKMADFRKNNLGFVFQDFNLLDTLTIRMLLETFTHMNEQMNATILMVTHDAFSASYCKRILFLKDGKIFHELQKGSRSRKEFLDEILDVLSLTGGDGDAE